MAGRQLLYSDWLPVGSQWHADSELSSLITAALAALTGVSRVTAEYRLIQTVDSMEMYGASYHTARNSAGATLNIATTSTGVVFFSEDWKQLNR